MPPEDVVEDLISMSVHGIDISKLNKSTEELMEGLMDNLLESLPKDMYAYKIEEHICYDYNNTDGDIVASFQTHPEDERLRRVVFIKNNEEIYNEEKASLFILKVSSFIGRQLIEQLCK